MIQADGVYYQYGNVDSDPYALEDISFHTEAGFIYGLAGADGAGKTTFMRILSTLLRPTRGRVWIDGMDIVAKRQAVSQIIGVVTDTIRVYDHLSVMEYMEFFAHCYSVYKPGDRLMYLLEVFGLVEMRKKMAASLPKGMQQRLSIARALIHDPKILILDEPTYAMDTQMERDVSNLLLALKEKGITIMISDSNVSHLKNICDKVAVMERGRLIEIEEREHATAEKVCFIIQHDPSLITSFLRQDSRVQSVQSWEKRVDILIEGGLEAATELLDAMLKRNLPVSGMYRLDEPAKEETL